LINNKENNCLVSVCVQTYQHEKYIEKCLDSVLMQKTDFPFEIIVGEDESNDQTRDICIKYSETYPEKIKLHLRSRKDVISMNGKPTGRFNVVENYKTVTGKYIAICEGDDYWTDPYKLQKQVNYLELNPSAVGCFHNSVTVDENNDVLNNQYFMQTETKVWNQEECLKTLKSSFSTASILFKSSAIKFQLDEYIKIGSDFILDILITEHGDLHYLDENMSAYRLHQGGIWQGQAKQHNYIITLKRFLFLYSNSTIKMKYKGYLGDKIIEFHNKIIINSTSANEKLNYKLSKLRFLDYSPLYLMNRIKMSIHYRTKPLKNK
jgi:glycosyltransferase involved in cell wall biosynthesis